MTHPHDDTSPGLVYRVCRQNIPFIYQSSLQTTISAIGWDFHRPRTKAYLHQRHTFLVKCRETDFKERKFSSSGGRRGGAHCDQAAAVGGVG